MRGGSARGNERPLFPLPYPGLFPPSQTAAAGVGPGEQMSSSKQVLEKSLLKGTG